MISGYLALGGKHPPVTLTLPAGCAALDGNIGVRNRGVWYMTSDLVERVINIPSRDKAVHVLATDRILDPVVAAIDSAEGPNYKTKLLQLTPELPEGFHAALINRNVSTHSSFALVSNTPVFVYGIYDQMLEQAYLFWSTDSNALVNAVAFDPLRFLLYRFPVLSGCLFVQIETVCAKWWRWSKNNSELMAFNALERRLYGPLEV